MDSNSENRVENSMKNTNDTRGLSINDIEVSLTLNEVVKEVTMSPGLPTRNALMSIDKNS